DAASVCLANAASEAHAANDFGNEKRARSLLAWSKWAGNHFEESFAAFNDVVALARATNDKRLEASTINFIGLSYQNLGDPAKAMANYEQALAIARTLDDPKLLGEVLYHLAWIRFYRGDHRESIPLYEQSLAARREAHDVFGEGVTLAGLGMAYHAVGDYQKSIDYEQAALPLLQQSGDRRGEADALDHIGIALTDLGRARDAESYHRQALDIRHEINDRFGSTMSLAAIAHARRALGDIDGAIESYRQVIDIIESVRQSLGDRALRGSMFAARQGHYRRMIDLLMDGHRDAEALSISERDRARLTLDALQGANATPLTTEEIQRDVLDRDTALVEYSLGSERSYVWVATTTSVTTHTLPKRSEIESAAKHLHELLAAREDRKRQHDIDAAITSFAKLVLPPLPKNVTRLLIVADGALHFVPFSMLDNLIERYE